MYTLAYSNVYTMKRYKQRQLDTREAERLISKIKTPAKEFLLVKIPMKLVRDYRGKDGRWGRR